MIMWYMVAIEMRKLHYWLKVYNGFLFAFSVSLGIGVVSGNESDLSQDGKIIAQQ